MLCGILGRGRLEQGSLTYLLTFCGENHKTTNATNHLPTYLPSCLRLLTYLLARTDVTTPMSHGPPWRIGAEQYRPLLQGVSGRVTVVIFYLVYVFLSYLPYDNVLDLVSGLGTTRRIAPPLTPASPNVALVAMCVCHNSQALSNERHGFQQQPTTIKKTVSVGPGCPEPAMVVADSEE